jgi:predicted esterase
MIKRMVQENGIVADLFHDNSGKPHKALVLLGGSEGGKVWSSLQTRKLVNQLVSQGYTLLSLAYFNAEGLPPLLSEVPLEYFENAFHWLASQPEILSDELALMGISKGGEVSLLLGGMHPNIKAIIALSPSHVVWQEVPRVGARMGPDVKSEWSYQGKGLSCIPYGIAAYTIGTVIKTLLFGELCKIHEQALLNSSSFEAARIPVEKIQAAILLISGKRDKMWPSTMMSEQVISRLTDKGFSYPYRHIAYDSGHNNYIIKPEFQQEICDFLRVNYPPE